MPKKRYYDKSMSKSDGAMISSGGGIANMPTELVMKYYPKDGPYFTEDLDDSMREIDSNKAADVNIAKKQSNDSKF